MSYLTYRVGDATQPEGRPALVAHVANDLGVMGAGFAKALVERHPCVFSDYTRHLNEAAARRSSALGDVVFSEVDDPVGRLAIASMVAQHGVASSVNTRPLSYDRLDECLAKTFAFAGREGFPAVHMPRIGSGLARGNWTVVQALIQGAASKYRIQAYVYDLP